MPQAQTVVRAPCTIHQKNRFYRVFHMLKLVSCLLTIILYPYYTINGFPILGKMFWFLVGLEGVFFIDIILNFFVQCVDENGFYEELPLSKVS
jgi:hypothetical protein